VKENGINLKRDERGSIGYAPPKSMVERRERLKERPYLVSLGLLGVLMVGVGILSAVLIANKMAGNELEIVEMDQEEKGSGEVYVDVGGAVMRPGLYKLSSEARVNDALAAAGGLEAEADRDWFSKNINLAQKVTDGAKIYIPFQGETSGQSDSATGQVSGAAISGKINVNTASAAELDQLWGVGPATAEKIISGRPYGSVEELLTKKILNSNVYERCKDEVTVY
jgi:competence protein ComEA